MSTTSSFNLFFVFVPLLCPIITHSTLLISLLSVNSPKSLSHSYPNALFHPYLLFCRNPLPNSPLVLVVLLGANPRTAV